MIHRSYRDPDGAVFGSHDAILRVVTSGSEANVAAFLGSSLQEQLVADGLLVATRTPVGALPDWLTQSAGPKPYVLAHERIPVPTYPYEWPAEMLMSAAQLTLNVLERALHAGWNLKDATPFNVLFRGARPVWVDVTSFERRDPFDPLWLPYAQFVRTFIFPLLLDKYAGVPAAHTLALAADGPDPRHVLRLMPLRRRLNSVVLKLAVLPTLFAAAGAQNGRPFRRRCATEAEATFVLQRMLQTLRRSLLQLGPREQRVSVWSGYTTRLPYPETGVAAKRELVRRVVAEKSGWMLDLGANTGEYSLLAARLGARVVSVEKDAVCMARLWQAANAESLDVLPIVADICDPTPRRGWRNSERLALLERLRGRFDVVLMLGLVHHLTIGERIPMPEILRLARNLTRAGVILEYVSPDDPMSVAIVRGRSIPDAMMTRQAFEAECAPVFRIEHWEQIAEHRWIYLLATPSPGASDPDTFGLQALLEGADPMPTK